MCPSMLHGGQSILHMRHHGFRGRGAVCVSTLNVNQNKLSELMATATEGPVSPIRGALNR